jgi:hypothetical protein
MQVGQIEERREHIRIAGILTMISTGVENVCERFWFGPFDIEHPAAFDRDWSSV